MVTNILIRPIRPEDIPQIHRLFTEDVQTIRSMWRAMLIHGTFRLFWREISLAAIVVGALTRLYFDQVYLAPLVVLAAVVTMLGWRKLITVTNRFGNTAQHFRSCIDAGAVFHVAEVDRELVGVLGVEWHSEVRNI